MRTLVVVPMKALAQSKTRLTDALDASRRAMLARHLFERTITTLAGLRSRGGFDLAVVTACDRIAATGRSAGTISITDPDKGLNAALSAASRFAGTADYARLCIFPADLAAPEESDLLTVIRTDAPADAVLIVPATDGGTNALRLRPGAMGFHFGPDSANRHKRAAQMAGLDPVILPLDSLSHDIDTGRDLARAMRTDRTLEATL